MSETAEEYVVDSSIFAPSIYDGKTHPSDVIQIRISSSKNLDIVVASQWIWGIYIDICILSSQQSFLKVKNYEYTENNLREWKFIFGLYL